MNILSLLTKQNILMWAYNNFDPDNNGREEWVYDEIR